MNSEGLPGGLSLPSNRSHAEGHLNSPVPVVAAEEQTRASSLDLKFLEVSSAPGRDHHPVALVLEEVGPHLEALSDRDNHRVPFLAGEEVLDRDAPSFLDVEEPNDPFRDVADVAACAVVLLEAYGVEGQRDHALDHPEAPKVGHSYAMDAVAVALRVDLAVAHREVRVALASAYAVLAEALAAEVHDGPGWACVMGLDPVQRVEAVAAGTGCVEKVTVQGFGKEVP